MISVSSYLKKEQKFKKSLITEKMAPTKIVGNIIPSDEFSEQNPSGRRSGNYQLSIWDLNFIQSLNNPYVGEKYSKLAGELKEQVKKMLEEEDEQREALYKFELIDDLQRLGLLYCFESHVKQALANLYEKFRNDPLANHDDLYAAALKFRLFRQHGFQVSEDAFTSFISKNGGLKPSTHEDTGGVLYLYEASYLSLEGENTLELARELTTKILKKKKKKIVEDDKYVDALVHHALALPTYWRINRVEARWFIEIYEQKPTKNPILLELAKLDFNFVQAIYQEDLKFVAKWWKGTRIMENLTFTRDCVVTCFQWTVGMMHEPQDSYSRRMLTKVAALITVIDDVYDVYGTLDELQLFTDVVQRWDINGVEELPLYMRVVFLELFNAINGMAYDALKDQGIYTVPYLTKLWGELCKAYLQEAKWYFSKYKPSLEEYMEIASVSITAPVGLSHAYVATANPIRKEALEGTVNHHDIIYFTGFLLRLSDDLGTSSDEMKRGDVPKAVQCRMIETGESEEVARGNIRLLIQEKWRKLNTAMHAQDSPFCERFLKIAMGLIRSGQCIYEFGDGHCNLDHISKVRVQALFFDPVPIDGSY